MKTLVTAMLVIAAAPLIADDSGPSIVDDAGSSVADEAVTLRYRLTEGEQLRYRVTHVAKTKTTINGTEELSDMTSESVRHWDVTAADDTGATFDHVIDSVDMTQVDGEGDQRGWSSESGEEPPTRFQGVADKVGTVIATVTINPRGQELGRADDQSIKTDLGMGGLTLALPEAPVAVGSSWSVPREIRVRDDNGDRQTIKIQERYTLRKVKTGVAVIDVRSEPITPIRSQAVQSQVVQQLSNGTVRFDIDAGHLISKTLDWDENVVGFRGPASAMSYRANLTETLIR